MLEVTLAIVATGAALGLLGAVTYQDSQRRAGSWRRFRIHFGRDVSAGAVAAVLDHISGLPAGRTVVLELRSEPGLITHYLEAEEATVSSIEGGLRALMPGLRLTPEKLMSERRFGSGRAIRLAHGGGSLRTDDFEASAATLLGSLTGLAEGEAVAVRWTLAGATAAAVKDPKAHGKARFERYHHLRGKNRNRMLKARGFILGTAASRARAREILDPVASTMRSRSTPHGELRFPPLPRFLLDRAAVRTTGRGGGLINSAELTGLIGWPVGAPAIPGLSLGASPVLIPESRLPATGKVLGQATWPGLERPIAQPVKGALSHALATGPTGVGKSTLMTNMICDDLAAGRAVVLIDGKGDTAEAVLARVPDNRVDDLIVLDCAADHSQPGLKLFRGEDSELAADVVLGVLTDLFRDNWGPLSERYLRAALVAVAHDPEGSIADVPFVFSDAAYRRELVGRISDPLTKATFTAFEIMRQAARQQQLAAPLNKLGSLLGRPIVRSVLGQADPVLDFSRVLGERKVVIVSLSPARVGGPASRLIGALCLFALFQAVQGRSSLPAADREPAFAYVDEPRALGELPMPLGALLEQARGLGVGVCLAPQSLTQLPPGVREAVLTNVATRIVFRQNADDARLLARDLRGIGPENLGDLAAWEAIARIGIGPGDVASPVSIKTFPAPPLLRDAAETALTAARRWGKDVEEIDQALRERHRSDRPSLGAVGRKRRAA